MQIGQHHYQHQPAPERNTPGWKSGFQALLKKCPTPCPNSTKQHPRFQTAPRIEFRFSSTQSFRKHPLLTTPSPNGTLGSRVEFQFLGRRGQTVHRSQLQRLKPNFVQGSVSQPERLARHAPGERLASRVGGWNPRNSQHLLW